MSTYYATCQVGYLQLQYADTYSNTNGELTDYSAGPGIYVTDTSISSLKSDWDTAFSNLVTGWPQPPATQTFPPGHTQHFLYPQYRGTITLYQTADDGSGMSVLFESTVKANNYTAFVAAVQGVMDSYLAAL
jgi:hypothetical protein